MKPICIASLLLLLSFPGVAETIWLDEQMRPVEEAEATYFLEDIVESEEGYYMRVNYITGELRYETSIDQPEAEGANSVGDYRLYYRSGQLLQEGTRDEQGRVQGMVTSYHENGEVHREVPYQDDQVHGLYLTYAEDGTLLREQHVKKNKRHGPNKSYFGSGELRFESHYVDGNKEGIEKSWSPDGVLLRKQYFTAGNLDGLVESYFDDGQIKSRGEYDNRTRVGEHKTWYENGNLQRYQFFDDNGKEKITRTFRQDGTPRQVKEPVDSDYGPATLTERYNESGQVIHRTKQSDDNQWYVSERYDDDGELTEWHQTLDRKRHGRAFNSRWGGGYTEAYYVEGEYHGDYKEVDGDGNTVVAGTYMHGDRVGDWYQHLGHVQYYEFYDEEGKLHGERKQLDADGQLVLREHYRHGVRHGEVEGYENGELAAQGKYVEGQRHGPWKIRGGYYSAASMEGEYASGVQVGEWRQYSTNGYLLGISHYDEEGRDHGRQLNFEENGALTTSIDYKHGVRHGEYWFYSQGTPAMRSVYNDGELVEEQAVEDMSE